MALCTSAEAGIYKCAENGKVVFRDKPCQLGQGKQLNLGATIENDDPTGNKGDVSGNFGVDSTTVSINDALGMLDRNNNTLSLYFIPERYTSAEVEHFRDTGDDSLLEQKPPLDSKMSMQYPFFNLVIRYRKEQPRNRQNIEEIVLRMFGLSTEPRPLVIEQSAEEASAAIRQLAVFEDVTFGDIDLEAEQEIEIEGKAVRWKLSVRAPLYYR